LEITVSFLGIQKWEPDIYFGLSPALHLQCEAKQEKSKRKPFRLEAKNGYFPLVLHRSETAKS
jgi:hypothetical protein